MGGHGVFNQMGHTPMTFSFKRASIVFAALLSLSASAGLAVPSFAQDAPSAQPTEISPESLALALKYVESTDRSGLYEVTLIRAATDTYRQLLQQNPAIAEQINTAIEGTLSFYKDKKGDLFDQIARLYALTFSTEELQQISDFYASPVGQKLSQANAEINPAIQSLVRVFTDNLNQEFFAKVRAALKAEGIDT
jgi:hypothetical protein